MLSYSQPAILDFFPSLHSTPILRQLVQLLHAHDTEVNMSCMQILRGTSSHPPVLQTLAGLGLHDVLDSIQVRELAALLALRLSKLSQFLKSQSLYPIAVM